MSLKKFTMKKISVLVLALMVFFSISSYAQRGSRGAESKQTLMDSLKISETTADSVIAIHERSASQVKAIFNDQSLSQDQKKEKIRPIKEDTKKQLEKYLNKDQMAKLQEMAMERRESMKDKHQQTQ